MATARGSAFGKLILLGEHAVVYGAPALAAGIALACHAEARREGDVRRLHLYDQEGVADTRGDDLARAFAALLDEGGAPEGLVVEVRGDLPAGVGLGFSATAAVAIARAVEALAGEASPTADRVRARAMAWERIFHGNPSGVDVAAAMRGGVSRFQRQPEGAAQIRRVAVGAPLTLCVGLTGTRASTREMVGNVAALSRSQPEVVRRSVDAIATLVENGVGAVERGDARALGELMNLNQMLLAGLMLSTAAIEEMCAGAREAGALGAKLTGSGGGGAVVALTGSGDEAELCAAKVIAGWRERGFGGFHTRLGTT